jgi:uncharacterized protein (TIGR03000 family)
MSSQGYYGAPAGDMGPSDRTVLIDVRVPPDAEIWFEGAKTQSTGMFREFVSPALEPGQDYTYQVRARWMENGQEVNKDRELRVRAGNQLALDFLGESAAASTFPSEQPARGPAMDRAPVYGTDRNVDRPATDRTSEQQSRDRAIDRTGTGTAPGTTPSTAPGTPPSDIPPGGTKPPE